MRRAPFVVGGVVVGMLAAFHLVFALTNFGLAAEDDTVLSAPLGEGVLAVVAAVALAAAAALLAKRRLYRAAVVALAGTAPLPVFFAFTVPEHSDPISLFLSLLVPGAATALAARGGRAPD